MAIGNVGVKGVTSAEIKAVEQILNGIAALIGETGSTGGSTTAGTMMAKLNQLLQNEIDVSALLGQTGNTGGTTTAGTVMAKLNKLLTDWTNTRANRIDSIYNNIGTAGNTGGTATAGTVMAKLNALLSTMSNGLGIKIKSLQQGFVNYENVYYVNASNISSRDITINSVDKEKSILLTFNNGSMPGEDGTIDAAWQVPQLINNNTIRQQNYYSGYHATLKKYSAQFNSFYYYVIEFEW